jgi:Ni,Fe-hydrogenase I large subunit
VSSAAELDAWLGEREEHRQGDLGFFLRYARALGLHRLGRGHVVRSFDPCLVCTVHAFDARGGAARVRLGG